MELARNLLFRAARASDREAVFAMVATVWDGTDYIPDVWDAWLAAEDGPLVVGVLGTQPVALYKLTALGPHEDWLEGVRVDPVFRGQGIARALTRDAIERSRQRAKRTLRYQTSEQNPTMQHLAAELGFQLDYAPEWYAAPAVIGTPIYQPLAAERVGELLDELAQSALLKLTGGLYTYRWKAYEMTAQRLRDHAKRGEIVGLAGDQAWAILMSTPYGGFWLAFAAGPTDELTRLFAELPVSESPIDGDAFVRAHVPPATPFIPALLRAGYTLGDHGARIYSYHL